MTEAVPCSLRTYICFSRGTAGSTLSPKIPQNSGLPCLMGLKPPPGARSWRRRSREGEGDDCRFSLPLNWAVGEKESARSSECHPSLLGGAQWGNSLLLSLGLYDSQGEELQAMNEHGSRDLTFLQQVLSEPDGAFKGLAECPSRGH